MLEYVRLAARAWGDAEGDMIGWKVFTGMLISQVKDKYRSIGMCPLRLGMHAGYFQCVASLPGLRYWWSRD